METSGILLQSASLQLASASTPRGSYSANWSPTHRQLLAPDRTIADSCELEQSQTPDPGYRSYSGIMAIYLLPAERLPFVISSDVDRCVAKSNTLLMSSQPSSQTHHSCLLHPQRLSQQLGRTCFSKIMIFYVHRQTQSQKLIARSSLHCES